MLPTDHVYLSFVDPWGNNQQNNDCRQRPVRAAASGVVMFTYVTEAAGDTKVQIQTSKTFYYFYDHVILKPGITMGSRVSSGDTIATTTGRCPSIDLGVIDLDVPLQGLFNAKRYNLSAFAAPPYRYFSEPLKSFYYAHVRMAEGVPAFKDGRTDWGIAGKLQGDWFHSSIASDDGSVSMGPNGWPKTVAFARDWFDTTQVRISIGGTIAPAGVLRIGAGDPDPSRVSVADGVVAYQGTPTLGFIQPGWLLVQMLANDRMRIEYFSGANTRPSTFTAAAQDYVR